MTAGVDIAVVIVGGRARLFKGHVLENGKDWWSFTQTILSSAATPPPPGVYDVEINGVSQSAHLTITDQGYIVLNSHRQVDATHTLLQQS